MSLEITQRYERASTATITDEGLGLDLTTESSRPPVFLDAGIRDGASYRRAMLALYAVVQADLAGVTRDHSDYQTWVQERYLEALSPIEQARNHRLQQLQTERQELLPQLTELRARVSTLDDQIRSLTPKPTGKDGYHAAQREYFTWLRRNMDAWIVLDPVVSVHPDAVMFEVFSQDESSYGRVTLTMSGLSLNAPITPGTTNVDFSPTLARSIGRIRTYRPARLHVGGGAVGVATEAGTAIEKKIALPPTWVRGFLQVQSAAALPGVDLRLGAGTVANILAHLTQRREDRGPRSLRFQLVPGEPVRIEIEPWEIVITDHLGAYEGPREESIRVWGRRRLLAFQDLLAHADDVEVRLLGSGMPSFWSLTMDETRFDLGLSGWSGNDWSRRANFDLLASPTVATPRELVLVAGVLAEKLRLTPSEAAERTGLSREAATAVLQQLLREGRAMYDPSVQAYRSRQLLPGALAPESSAPDARTTLARALVASGAVSEPEIIESESGRMRLGYTVHTQRDVHVVLERDDDGRVIYAECSCAEFRKHRLRQGPCAHITAAAVSHLSVRK